MATQELKVLLADSYSLYLKTHNFHWNVTGPHFAALHNLFEEQYSELATAVDEIAERIRALGDKAPGSYQEFSRLSSIEQAIGDGEHIPALDMVRQLAGDHRSLAKQAQHVLKAAAEIDDDPSADLATQRMNVHEKAAWMLGAMLEA